jgi:hypothetical protein
VHVTCEWVPIRRVRSRSSRPSAIVEVIARKIVAIPDVVDEPRAGSTDPSMLGIGSTKMWLVTSTCQVIADVTDR